jgi:hypothetical protein
MSLILGAIGGYLGKLSADRQASAAKDAAQLEAQAAERAAALQEKQFNQVREDFSPYRDHGVYGAGQLRQGLESGAFDAPTFDFQARTRNYDLGTDPVFQNVLDQAMKRVQASAAARGMLSGGGTLRALQREGVNFGQQFENQDYNRFQGEEATRYGRAADTYNRTYGARQDKANRFQGLGAMGMGAAGQTGQFGSNAASEIGRLGMAGASALGEGMAQSAAYKGLGQRALFEGVNSGINDAARMWGRFGMGG